MPFESKKASRGNVRPLIGFYGESGTGKSMSSLLLARGLVGPNGNIQQIDSEQGRGELYSDVIPGGYNTIRLDEPYSPARYSEAIAYAESLKADVIVIDQASSEWESVGGVLDMAAGIEAEGKRGLAVWKQPKMEHAKFVQKLLRATCPVIVCLRAKQKSRQIKVNGKTEIVKDDNCTPIQADDFIFELVLHAETLQDHSIKLSKVSHPTLRACFPEDGKPITVQHGELLAKWCANPGAKHSTKLDTLKRALFAATKSKHGGDVGKLEQWLHDVNALSKALRLADLTEQQLAEVNEKAEIVMKEGK